MPVKLALLALLALPLTAQPPHTVTLAWVASSVVAPFVAPTSYNVRRSPISGGPYNQLLATVPNLTYIDTMSGSTALPEGSTACYVVTALDSSGKETAIDANGEVCVVIPFLVAPVLPPGKLTAIPR